MAYKMRYAVVTVVRAGRGVNKRSTRCTAQNRLNSNFIKKLIKLTAVGKIPLTAKKKKKDVKGA